MLCFATHRAERRAAHVLHRDVPAAVIESEVVDVRDAGVREQREDRGLVAEVVERGGAFTEVRVQPLHDRWANEAAVAPLVGEIHVAHAAGGELVHELETTEQVRHPREHSRGLAVESRALASSGDGSA